MVTGWYGPSERLAGPSGLWTAPALQAGPLGRGRASLKEVKVLLCVNGLLGSRGRGGCDITVFSQEARKEFVQLEPVRRNLSGKRGNSDWGRLRHTLWAG